MSGYPEQTVVVYDSPRGRDIPFDCAYNLEQTRRAVMRCVGKYGRSANVRSIDSRKRWREERPAL